MFPVTPRVTRLVRVADLRAFRDAAVTLASDGPPLSARDRLVIVPTRAASAQLVRSLERRRLTGGGAVVLPLFATPRELPLVFGERLPPNRPLLTAAEREVLLRVACRHAVASGVEPPFKLRPALIAEMLDFYDTLHWNQRDVDAFERLALGRLEPGADIDRGAERLVRQTRFLVASFREFERQCEPHGDDERGLRTRLLTTASDRPFRHAIVTVGDRAFDRHGLAAAHWDLLARVPGLERLDVLVTDGTLAGACHERIHTLLPAIDEIRFESPGDRQPVVVGARGGSPVHVARDREEEIAGFAKRVRHAARRGTPLDSMALVVERPLPYLYVARETFRSGGLATQMFDALPLAAEPYAVALDLVMTAVTTGFTRSSSIALLRSPQLRFGACDDEIRPQDAAALDRAMREARYLGEVDALERLVDGWRRNGDRLEPGALRAGAALVEIARELAVLRTSAGAAAHLSVLLGFLACHERPIDAGDPLAGRLLRARGGVISALRDLRDAYTRFDPAPVVFDEVVALVRRRIEGHTFAPRMADSGVHLVDAEGARFGEFDLVQLAGLVDGEWPEPPGRSIFYSSDILRELGWPSESDRQQAARARFDDLLGLPSSQLVVSTFSLDGDAIVTPSLLISDLDLQGLKVVEDTLPGTRIFEHEALGLDPVTLEALGPFARAWALLRMDLGDRRSAGHHGFTEPHRPPAYSVSALERYQDCPFKFFSADVLRLEETPEREGVFSPRDRGRLVHEVLRRFFDAWDAQGLGPITPARLGEARALFATAAEPLLAQLGESDAMLERMALFGSAVAVGVADIVLGFEAVRPVHVMERWLEHRLDGGVALTTGGSVQIKGIADRIDLLPDRRLRVIDYKSGSAPDPRRALQVPIYALAAQERLERRDDRPWAVEQAAYLVLGGGRTLVPAAAGDEGDRREALEAARVRLTRAVDGIQSGVFPPRPYDAVICRTCAFSTVCRKDYVGDA